MKKNIGKTDRLIRILIGLVIAILGVVNQSWWGLLALIPLITALISFCPVYAILGINTCGKKR